MSALLNREQITSHYKQDTGHCVSVKFRFSKMESSISKNIKELSYLPSPCRNNKRLVSPRDCLEEKVTKVT